METLDISYHPELNTQQSAEFIHELLGTADKGNIDLTAWENKNYLCNCAFAVLYGEDAVAIRYFVTEDNIKAVYNKPNDPVYKDSCVEFFIALDDSSYYNFEFNCNGTCLAQIGADKQNRSFIPANIINSIKTYKRLKTIHIAGSQLITWELTVVIPFTAFIKHQVQSLKGRQYKVNFYKCGDDLPEPHYLCWNKVETPEPNFHKPEYFGIGRFV